MIRVFAGCRLLDAVNDHAKVLAFRLHVGIVSNALLDPSMLCATSPDLVLSPLRNSAHFEILLKAPSVARGAQLGSPPSLRSVKRTRSSLFLWDDGPRLQQFNTRAAHVFQESFEHDFASLLAEF